MLLISGEAAPGQYGILRLQLASDGLGVTSLRLRLSIDSAPTAPYHICERRVFHRRGLNAIGELNSRNGVAGCVFLMGGVADDSPCESKVATEDVARAVKQSSGGNSARDNPLRRAAFHSCILQPGGRRTLCARAA